MGYSSAIGESLYESGLVNFKPVTRTLSVDLVNGFQWPVEWEQQDRGTVGSNDHARVFDFSFSLLSRIYEQEGISTWVYEPFKFFLRSKGGPNGWDYTVTELLPNTVLADGSSNLLQNASLYQDASGVLDLALLNNAINFDTNTRIGFDFKGEDNGKNAPVPFSYIQFRDFGIYYTSNMSRAPAGNSLMLAYVLDKLSLTKDELSPMLKDVWSYMETWIGSDDLSGSPLSRDDAWALAGLISEQPSNDDEIAQLLSGQGVSGQDTSGNTLMEAVSGDTLLVDLSGGETESTPISNYLNGKTNKTEAMLSAYVYVLKLISDNLRGNQDYWPEVDASGNSAIDMSGDEVVVSIKKNLLDSFGNPSGVEIAQNIYYEILYGNADFELKPWERFVNIFYLLFVGGDYKQYHTLSNISDFQTELYGTSTAVPFLKYKPTLNELFVNRNSQQNFNETSYARLKNVQNKLWNDGEPHRDSDMVVRKGDLILTKDSDPNFTFLFPETAAMVEANKTVFAQNYSGDASKNLTAVWKFDLKVEALYDYPEPTVDLSGNISYGTPTIIDTSGTEVKINLSLIGAGLIDDLPQTDISLVIGQRTQLTIDSNNPMFKWMSPSQITGKDPNKRQADFKPIGFAPYQSMKLVIFYDNSAAGVETNTTSVYEIEQLPDFTFRYIYSIGGEAPSSAADIGDRLPSKASGNYYSQPNGNIDTTNLKELMNGGFWLANYLSLEFNRKRGFSFGTDYVSQGDCEIMYTFFNSNGFGAEEAILQNKGTIVKQIRGTFPANDTEVRKRVTLYVEPTTEVYDMVLQTMITPDVLFRGEYFTISDLPDFDASNNVICDITDALVANVDGFNDSTLIQLLDADALEFNIEPADVNAKSHWSKYENSWDNLFTIKKKADKLNPINSNTPDLDLIFHNHPKYLLKRNLFAQDSDNGMKLTPGTRNFDSQNNPSNHVKLLSPGESPSVAADYITYSSNYIFGLHGASQPSTTPLLRNKSQLKSAFNNQYSKVIESQTRQLNQANVSGFSDFGNPAYVAYSLIKTTHPERFDGPLNALLNLYADLSNSYSEPDIPIMAGHLEPQYGLPFKDGDILATNVKVAAVDASTIGIGNSSIADRVYKLELVLHETERDDAITNNPSIPESERLQLQEDLAQEFILLFDTKLSYDASLVAQVSEIIRTASIEDNSGDTVWNAYTGLYVTHDPRIGSHIPLSDIRKTLNLLWVVAYNELIRTSGGIKLTNVNRSVILSNSTNLTGGKFIIDVDDVQPALLQLAN